MVKRYICKNFRSAVGPSLPNCALSPNWNVVLSKVKELTTLGANASQSNEYYKSKEREFAMYFQREIIETDINCKDDLKNNGHQRIHICKNAAEKKDGSKIFR